MIKLNESMIKNKKFGIGVDIENIDRFRNLNSINNNSFLNKIFTKNELDYCFSKNNPAQHLAARYAGKEAIIKALTSIGKLNLNYNAVEIFNNKNNAPIVKFNDKNYQNLHVCLSLSHCNDKAIAFTIITGADEM